MAVDRSAQIMRILERNSTWTTASSLAAELGCSIRTIKNDVGALNRRVPGVISSGPKGYRIGDGQLVASLISHGGSDIPQTVGERRKHILFELLMRNRAIGSAILADDLCVSLSTLDNELVGVKRELSGYGLSLRSREGMLFVEGDERSQKKLVNSLIFDETKGFFSQIGLVNRFFPAIDLHALRSRIETVLKDHGFFINDYALSNIIMHIAVSAERARNGFPTREPAFAPDRDDRARSGRDEIGRLVLEIAGIVSEECGTELPGADLEALGLTLSANLTQREHIEFEGERYREAGALFEDIRRRVADDFDLDFSNKDFELRFTLHLVNMLFRSRAGVPLRNPQLADIKNGYPFIYDVAVSVADIVQARTGEELSEDEIGYIALHVGCLMDEQISNVDKLHGALVTLRHSSLDAARIKGFSDKLSSLLVIEGVYSDYDGIGGCDLVISDMQIPAGLAIPAVQISPFLNEQDVRAVSERVGAIKRVRARTGLKHDLEVFFNADLFLVDPGFDGRNEAIESMGGMLVDGGYAFPDFTDRLRKREAVSASAYQDIALPHPLDMDARSTAVAVSLHPRGLEWGATTVHAVFMLAIRRDDRALFHEIFDLIARVLLEPGAVQAISRASTFEEFVDLLLERV